MITLPMRFAIHSQQPCRSFVKSAVQEFMPLVDEETRQAIREDLDIIDSSLTFMNDLFAVHD
jgi:hypothetical protein